MREESASWGTSFSGGYVLYLGTFDRRVKAVVAQVPYVGNPRSRHARSPQRWESDSQTMIQGRVDRYRTGIVEYVKVVAAPGEPCIIPGQMAYDFFVGSQRNAPNWHNQLTRESLEKMREFDPAGSIGLLAPTPLLIIAGERDELIPLDAAVEVLAGQGIPRRCTFCP